MSDRHSPDLPDEAGWLTICTGMLEVFAAVADRPVLRRSLVEALHAAAVPDAADVLQRLIDTDYLRLDPQTDTATPGPNLLAFAERLRRQ